MARTQKISRYTWEDLTGLEELKNYDMEQLRVNLKWALAERFPGHSLWRYLLFDSFMGFCGIEAEAVVYRLSTQIDRGLRETIEVWDEKFPVPGLSISLEEWRLMFENKFKDFLSIPLFLGDMPAL